MRIPRLGETQKKVKPVEIKNCGKRVPIGFVGRRLSCGTQFLQQDGVSGPIYSSNILAPHPEKRLRLSKRGLCRKHPDHFLKPSVQKRGRHVGCSRSASTYRKSPEARQRRASEFDSARDAWFRGTGVFIFCRCHPARIANRSRYVARGEARCKSCHHKRADGSHRLSYVRNQRLQSCKRSVIRRQRGFSTRAARGIEYFMRYTGMTSVDFPRRDA